jgi:DNA-binding NarL/FixJ family response regulator
MAISTSQPGRLLIVDDEPRLLDLLAAWFGYFDYELHIAPDGFKALALARELQFDVVLTDLQMPGLSGLHLLSLLKELDPFLEVIFLTGQATLDDAVEALRGGRAFDFIQKPVKNLRALNEVIDRAVARRRAASVAQAPGRLAPTPDYIEPLTEREREIVDALVAGLDNREIGEKLHLSEKTVKNNLTRIYEKLKVKNRTQAVALCQQLKLI